MEEVFLDLAGKSGTSFRMGDIVAPAVSALRSREVARDMLSLGTITMNIAAPGLFDKIDVSDGAPLMAVLFDYALEVAPRDAADEHVIDVMALREHVRFLRETFGDVDVSPEMILRIGQFAQMRINLESLAERETRVTPGNRES